MDEALIIFEGEPFQLGVPITKPDLSLEISKKLFNIGSGQWSFKAMP